MKAVCLLKVFLLILITTFLNSCSSIEKFQVKKDNNYQIFRIKNERHMDIDYTWFPLRDTTGNVIVDSIKAENYKSIYSADSIGNNLFFKSLPKNTQNQFTQKEASTEYFLGYQSLISGDSLSAKKHFNNSIRIDSSIIYNSDIYKLLGYTYSNNDSIAYYDSIYTLKSNQLVPDGFLSNPSNFHFDSLGFNLTGNEYISRHYLNAYAKVPYIARTNYAYLRNRQVPFGIDLGILLQHEGVAYNVGFSQKLTDNNLYSIQYLNSGFIDGFNLIFLHQPYQDIHNQTNYTIGISLNFHKFDIYKDKEINYYDLSLISQFSYSITDKIQFHNFGQIFYFNEFNHINTTDYEVWRNSTFNLGLTGYIYESFGAQSQLLFSTKGPKSKFSKDISLGFCLGDYEIGYRLFDKSIFMQAVSIPFFMNKFSTITK